MFTGSCHCGTVTFEVDTTELPPAVACHCSRCRKVSGHYWVGTEVPKDALTVHNEDHVTWYQSWEKVRRGFCKTCGAQLFWDPIFKDIISIGMGSFDTPTQSEISLHIYCADKGDYYEITDGIPQNEQ